MATKTITLELDAYEKLRRAKRSERESFSEVVRRARWEDASSNGVAILAHLAALRSKRPEAFLPDDVLDRIEERSRTRTARARARAEEGGRAR
jgi:predicted CopG family antitoxin